MKVVAQLLLVSLLLLVGFEECAAGDRLSRNARLAQQQEGVRNQLRSSLVASQWKFRVPESVLQRTFLQQGSTGRLKQVLLRLLTGQTVRIGVVGGSVTVARLDPEHGGYFGMLVEWLKVAFPKAKIIARNGAISGSTPMFAEHQLDTLLDPEVDLVLIEYSVNSKYREDTMHYEDIASYERLLREVLTGQRVRLGEAAKPAAVLMVNLWRCCTFNGNDKGYSYFPFGSSTPSDYLNILAQYYALPVLQVRNGMYHAYRTGLSPFKDLLKDFPPNEHNSMTHPNASGYQHIGDMVMYAFYVVLGQLEQYGVTLGDLDMIGEPLPPPMVSRHHHLVLQSWNAEALSSVVVKSKTDWAPKTEKGKYGWASDTPGHKMLLKFSSLIPGPALKRWRQEVGASSDKVEVRVHLGLLRSYEHMGVVQARCLTGCQCSPASFNTHDPSNPHSITMVYPVVVSQSQECRLELQIGEETQSGEHKQSLRGLAVVAMAPVPRYFEVSALPGQWMGEGEGQQ